MKGVSVPSAVLLALVFIGSGLAPSAADHRLGQISGQPPAPALRPALSQPSRSPKSGVRADLDFGRMPVYFIPNRGLLDRTVEFYSQGKDKTIYFTAQGLTFVLNRQGDNRPDDSVPTPWARLAPKKQDDKLGKISRNSTGAAAGRDIVKLDFVGSDPKVRPVGRETTGAIVSYFKGTPDKWQAGLPTYTEIAYPNLWPGIDLVYRGTVNRLKYEFIVHPGADPSLIRLAYRGATDVVINDQGRLVVSTPGGGFEDDTPVAYQELAGRRVDVTLAYRMAGAASAASGQATIKTGGPSSDESREFSAAHIYGFNVGSYDKTQMLIVDPAVLIYCGYIGGSGLDGYGGVAVAVDSSGCAYVAGRTASTQATFPVTVGPDLTMNGADDAFVAKVKADGTGLVYCGYIGGSGWDDEAFGIAVDASGCAYVVGMTSSTETTFPVTVGPDLTYNGGLHDAFVAKVKADGTGLVYCGYIGGSAEDIGFGIAVDSQGDAYVAGGTASDQTTFPVLVGPILTYTNKLDAFVAKVKADGTGLTYCGYIGGMGDDSAMGIAVDNTGSAYMTGYTDSTESDFIPFPVAVGPDLTYNGGNDGFVAKVKADGTGLLYCGYIGGSDDDSGLSIALDGAGCVYVCGNTDSAEDTFPVLAGPSLISSGGGDAYVAKVKADGTGLLYCGFIAGTSYENGAGIAVDGAGCAYVTGYTGSTEASFPVTGGPGLIHKGGYCDSYIAKVKPDGSGFVYCGYVGGSGYDWGSGVAVDAAGNAYISGETASSQQGSFPVTVGPDLTYNGNDDAYVAKVSYWDSWAPKHAVGDFDGDGKKEVAVDFGAAGIYIYDQGSWSQISSSNPESLLAADVDGDNADEILADLGAAGLWLWNGGAWSQLSGVNVEGLAVGNLDADASKEVVGDFGNVGLWLYNGGAWTQLSGVNADYVTVANVDGAGYDEIIGDFGATGLWVWNAGAWSILSGVNADYVMTGRQTGARFIAGDFGAIGLWMWSMPGLCTQLSGRNADYAIAANTDGDTEDEIVGDFGATGLWHCEGGPWTGSGFTWTILSSVNADFMIRADVDGNGTDEIVVDFGTLGLWQWNTGAWSQLSGVNPEYMLAGDFDGDNADEIMADFGALGLWLWNGGSWSKISPLNPD